MSKHGERFCGDANCLECLAKALGVPSIELIGFISAADPSTSRPDQPSPKKILADRVAGDLDEILSLHGETLQPAKPELPPPPEAARDTYHYQFDLARRRCKHDRNVTEILWRREFQCNDCGRYIQGDFRRYVY